MALPTSRDFDAVDAGPLPHTTVNNLQDAIVNARHGIIPVYVPATAWQGDTRDQTLDALRFVRPTAGADTGPRWEIVSGTNRKVSWSPNLPFGTVIHEMVVWEKDDNVTPNAMQVFEEQWGANSPTWTLLDSHTFSASAVSKVTTLDSGNMGSVFPYTVTAAQEITFDFDMNPTGAIFWGAYIQISKPT